LLARKRGIDSKQIEEYFTAGLLHDIGKIPISRVLFDEHLEAVKASDLDRIPLFLSERQKLGFDHCWAGGIIVKAWKLEGAIGDAILHHHTYTEYTGPHKDILYSVAAANRFAIIADIGFSGDRHPEKCDKLIWDGLGVSRDIFDEIAPLVNEEIEKARVFLRL
jgi:HD-like signal output (HDOD) protein